LQHEKAQIGAEFTSSQQNFVTIRMQLWLGNQELFVRLEHYRPYCYINYLNESCTIRCDSLKQLLISFQQLPIYVRSAAAGVVLFGAASVFCGPTAAQNAPLGPAAAPSSQAATLRAIEAYTAKDYARAANLFTQAAQDGNARAQFELGRMYLKGLGVEKDCAATAAWIGKAASQNLAIAQTLFGTLYLKGLCVSRDNATAMSWYDKAASLGDAAGQIMFGLMLADRKDYGEAMRWLRKGEANHVELLLEPEGEAKSIQIAKKLRGLAQYTIGLMYEAGAGVPKDIRQSINWYQKAAELGNDDAKVSFAQLQEFLRQRGRRYLGLMRRTLSRTD
jgi:TPR repeat protein